LFFESFALIWRQIKFETSTPMSFRDIQNQIVIIRPARDSFKTKYLPKSVSQGCQIRGPPGCYATRGNICKIKQQFRRLYIPPTATFISAAP